MSKDFPNQPGQQQPWTGPPTNASGGGGAIIVIVLVLGLVGLLGLGCVGIGVGMFWFRSVSVEQKMVEARLDEDMRELERLEAADALQEEALAKSDAEVQQLIDETDALAAAAATGKWTYEQSPEGFSGVIQERPGRIWVETRGDGVVFRFIEKAREREFVELFDESRRLQVRLYDDRLEWRRDGQDWSRGQSGAWSTTPSP